MVQNIENNTGIVLCGGKSRRMGSNKALLKLHGKYIISYPIKVLRKFSTQQIISTNNSDLDFLNIKTVADKYKNIGPIAGIYSVLKESSTQKNIILSCDTPFIDSATVEYMLEHSEGYEIVLPIYENHLQPMTGIFDKSIVFTIEKEILSGNYIPPRIFEKCKINKLIIPENISANYKHLFFNINSPADYEKAKKIELL